MLLQAFELTKVLADLVSKPLQSLMVISPGFCLTQEDGSPFELDLYSYDHPSDDRHIWRYRLKPGPVEAICRLNLIPSHSTALWELSLKNPSGGSAPGLKECLPLALKLKAENLPVRVLCIGGGLTHSHYPCPAYREHEVRLIRGASFQMQHGPDGRSSNEYLPIFMVGVGEVPQRLGFFAGLEWSATWKTSFFWPASESGIFQTNLGPGLSSLSITPGENVELPSVHFGLFEGDFEIGTNAVRRYIYDQISPDLKGRRPLPPTSYDHWFKIGNNYDENFLREQVDRAAQLGLEYFVLDAGWYGGSLSNKGFSDGLGNWRRVEPTKFPEGLEPLAEYVKGKGLKFGLWFEMERAQRGSDLQTAHPEWFFDRGAQWVHLNLALSEVQEYMIETVGGWIERLDLRWIRWDYNIGPLEFWQQADPSGRIQLLYMKGLYRVLDALMERNPQLLIECCSSGGRRIDFGTLKRAHTIWFSDHTDIAAVCRFMQTGANRFLPGHLLNSCIPTPRGARRDAILANEALSRMCGAFSIDGDLTGWSEGVVRRMKELVDTYKSVRPLLVKDFYRLTKQPNNDSDWDVVQFHDSKRQEGLVFAFRLAGLVEKRQLRLKALERTSYYAVRSLLNDPEQTLSGEQLMSSGWEFALPIDGAVLLHYHAIQEGSSPKKLST